MEPAKAERTGTALRPFPTSSAIRNPCVTVGVNPARADASTTTKVRRGACASRADTDRIAARHIATIATPSTVTTTPTAPSARTVASTCTPTSGSARRATPMGNNGDAATAPTTAINSPPPATIAANGAPMAARWLRVKPKARKVA